MIKMEIANWILEKKFPWRYSSQLMLEVFTMEPASLQKSQII